MKAAPTGMRPGWLAAIALIVPLAGLAFSVLAPAGYLLLTSERALVTQHRLLAPRGEPLAYLDHLPVSATWYSRGAAQRRSSGAGTLSGVPFWLGVRRGHGPPPAWNCTLRYRPRNSLFELYRCIPP